MEVLQVPLSCGDFLF